jgi:hypothetical protein
MKYLIKELKISLLIFLSLIIILMALLHESFLNQSKIFQNVFSILNNRAHMDSPMLLNNDQSHQYRKISMEVLPPPIELDFNGSTFLGQLISYKFREGYSFNELKEEEITIDIGNKLTTMHIPLIKNLSKYTSNDSITIKNGSKLQFAITNYPIRLQPSSLSINSYEIKSTLLQNPKVLGVSNNENKLIFNIDLQPGRYMLTATATWIPKTSNNIGGFVIYGYNITIKN